MREGAGASLFFAPWQQVLHMGCMQCSFIRGNYTQIVHSWQLHTDCSFVATTHRLFIRGNYTQIRGCCHRLWIQHVARWCTLVSRTAHCCKVRHYLCQDTQQSRAEAAAAAAQQHPLPSKHTSRIDNAKKAWSNSSASSTKLPKRMGTAPSPAQLRSTSQRFSGTCMATAQEDVGKEWRRGGARAPLPPGHAAACLL